VLCHHYAAAMDGLDALVTGSTLAPAPRIEELLKPPFFTWHYRMVMAPFSITGAPALSVCSGFSREGLPLSLQFAGRPFDDATVLRLGHAYEQATPWRQSRPAH
jgi:aspartyl-tRNA(Asn)/glutamyl-tRNA(Gln) amidotransferase subunit A